MNSLYQSTIVELLRQENRRLAAEQENLSEEIARQTKAVEEFLSLVDKGEEDLPTQSNHAPLGSEIFGALIELRRLVR